MNAAIATHLNVASDAILEIQEWAKVLWVRVRGLGCRFVSKKVAMSHPETVETVIYCNPESLRGVRIGDTFRSDDDKAVYKVSKIKDQYFVWEKDGVEYADRPRGYSDEKYKVEVVGKFFKMVQARV